MELYLEISEKQLQHVELPLPSQVILYVLQYCQTPSLKVKLVIVKRTTCGENDVNICIGESTLSGGIDYEFVEEENISDEVKNCQLPVIQDVAERMIRSGLCSCVRHLVSYTAKSRGDDSILNLLGFRQGSLKACAEVSGWTKLCEVELPESITTLIQIMRSDSDRKKIEIPGDLMKFELNLEKPPPLHNDDKKKRALLNKVKKELTSKYKNSSLDHSKICPNFFQIREDFLPHGSTFYRVITRTEKEAKKFDNHLCKFGCTENKLIKWCAKCNDREKDRQKDIQIVRNNIRKHCTDKVENVSMSTNQNGHTNHLEQSSTEISTVEELADYVKKLTLNDIEYDHTYAEGVMFTIADIMLFVYFYHLLESMNFTCGELFTHIPLIHKWLKHLVTLPRVQDTCLLSGYDLKQLQSCLVNPGKSSGEIGFSVPEEVIDLEDENKEISRRTRAKLRPLKSEIARILQKIEEQDIITEPGVHPRGKHVHVDWDTIPLEANPRVELPDKRVKRKCEQLENLATAVQEISKSGDIIVDFCSGGGHLGIIIAYLLPDCKVYMIENNEESLTRATDRVKKLDLHNVVLYQCNLDYFSGHFDIGVCLHACGVATDMVLQQCIERKASFVICPCCYGSIQNTHLISYPRSTLYREAGFIDKDVILLGHAADQTEFNIDLQTQGRHCMNLVDTDRRNLAIEHGYDVTLCSLQPLTCTPKNNLLIGRAPA